MEERRGRLNITRFIDSDKICKVAIVKEQKRPYRLMTEKWMIEQARKLGINTPEVLDYSIDEQKREVLTLKRINGQNICGLPLREKCDCLYSVGKQMKLLKSPVNGFGWLNHNSQCGTYNDWMSFLYSYTEIYGNNLVKEKIVSHKDMRLVMRLLSNISVDVQTAFLVNRDIKAGNIIRDEEGVVWVIDWENAILGDPLYDLAIFGSNYGHGKLWKSLIDGYGFTLPPLKYCVYQAIALLGTIDFCIKYNTPFAFRYKRLKKIMADLQNV